MASDDVEKLAKALELAFFKGMTSEHCVDPGNYFLFVAENYIIATTAAMEWANVVGRKNSYANQMRAGRRIPCVKDLLQLPITKRAKLTDFEMILYTGRRDQW